MRILFDGYWWAEGPRSNQQVDRELILAWERRFPEDELTVAVPRAAVEQARVELPERVAIWPTRLAPQGISAILELPWLARRSGTELVITHNFTPLVGPSAVFVHDVLFTTNPEWFTTKERLYFWLITATMPRARVVFTSSSSEADRIRSSGHARGPVIPIGLGLTPGLATAATAPVEELDGVDGFVLVVGRLNIRKNLATVLSAAMRSPVVGPGFPIVVVGEGSGRRAPLPEDVTEGVRTGTVRFLGFVSDEQLAWLYSRTRLFIFLSLDEGFGMPALEAIHFGAPVLVSDIPVFREILGDRADYVAPLDVDAVATAIDRLARSGRPEPTDPAELGYSWDASVERMRRAVTDGS